MSVLLKKENLFLRVAIGFIVGVVLGLVAPGIFISTKVVGDLYLNRIKLMIIPIVVCAVISLAIAWTIRPGWAPSLTMPSFTRARSPRPLSPAS